MVAVASGNAARTSRRRQLELNCISDIMQTIRDEARSKSHDMQVYLQQRLTYGVDLQPVETEEQSQEETSSSVVEVQLVEGSGVEELIDLYLAEQLVETIPPSAKLFDDYSFIYNEYID